MSKPYEPAAPVVVENWPEPESTLRDQFAMAALTGLATGLHWTPGKLIHENSIASDAYAIADKMMIARETT